MTTAAVTVVALSCEAARYARLRAAIPPADLRAVDVDPDEQVSLTLALLQRARAMRGQL